jgi:hypothetical protein
MGGFGQSHSLTKWITRSESTPMSVLIDKKTKVICQGFTGNKGQMVLLLPPKVYLELPS